MQTRYCRDQNGWNARTEIELQGQRKLSIRTSKRYAGKGIQTDSTVWRHDASGFAQHVMGFGSGGGDYSRRLAVSTPGRITEKQVREQHEKVLSQLDAILADVNAFYARADAQAEAKRQLQDQAAAIA